MKPHKKKSSRINSGERGGHAIGPSRLIHQPGIEYKDNLGILGDSEVVSHLADSNGVYLGYHRLSEELDNFEACQIKIQFTEFAS